MKEPEMISFSSYSELREQLADARSELAALRRVAEIANEIRSGYQNTWWPANWDKLTAALDAAAGAKSTNHPT